MKDLGVSFDRNINFNMQISEATKYYGFKIRNCLLTRRRRTWFGNRTITIKCRRLYRDSSEIIPIELFVGITYVTDLKGNTEEYFLD